MAYRTVYRTVEVEVDIDLGDFDTDDLIEELENRGHFDETDIESLVEIIYQKRRTGVDYQSELDVLIYNVIGRM